MIKWDETMTQTFEYYKVDPHTWKDDVKITTIIDSSIDRDGGAETLGSASFTTTELIGECYIRVYLIAIQNGITYKFALGTYLVQTPAYTFDGMVRKVTIDAYTPLIELKEKPPALGYFIPKDTNILEEVYRHVRDNLRAPVVSTISDETVPYDFVSDTSDTWLSYLNDLITVGKYNIGLDEMGRVIFEPKIETKAMAPTWIYNDDNSSILHPAITLDNDLYGIPNVLEVIYSTDEHFFHIRVENNDESSPISIQNRGREIVHRISNPEISGNPTEEKINQYAISQMKEMSSLEFVITFTHGYCPTKVGDCVILNYKRAGIKNVKGRVISQSISCIPGTPVEEKVVFTNSLWG